MVEDNQTKTPEQIAAEEAEAKRLEEEQAAADAAAEVKPKTQKDYMKGKVFTCECGHKECEDYEDYISCKSCGLNIPKKSK